MKTTLYLGRNDDQDHVYVDVALKRDGLTRQTIYHQSITNVLRLSISAVIIDGRRVSDKRAQAPDATPSGFHDRYWLRCGQCFEQMPTTTQGAELREIWERWHLNDMNSACAHQNPRLYGPHAYTQNDWSARAAMESRKCPHQYHYGSAWLTERLPDSVIATVCRIAGFDPTSL